MNCCLALVNKLVGLLNKSVPVNVLNPALLSCHQHSCVCFTVIILGKYGSKGIPQDHHLKKKKEFWSCFLKENVVEILNLETWIYLLVRVSAFFSCQCVTHLYPKNLESEIFVCSHMILLDTFIFEKIKIFLWGKILGYSAITDYVLTCRFSGSIPV